MTARRRKTGFTLVEMGVVLGLVAVIAAMAAPSLSQMFANQRLTDSAHVVGNALSYARGEAIRTGNVYLVFFRVDASGSVLEDPPGTPVDILVVDDGRLSEPGQNCKHDVGETTVRFNLGDGVSFNVSDASSTVATDAGDSSINNGSTFLDGSGGGASWVLFRSEGPAYGFKSDCTMGGAGSGGGGIYLTNGDRDVAVVLTPLGSARIHRWGSGGWTN